MEEVVSGEDNIARKNISREDTGLTTEEKSQIQRLPPEPRADGNGPQSGAVPVSKKEDVETETSSDPEEPCVRRIIRNFTPSWFIVTMGTGIVSTLLHQLPYNGQWLRIISIVFFVLNVFLFVVFSILSSLRYSIYPELWGAMMRHPHQSLFVGTFPTGLATIINMIVIVCVPAWGQPMVTLAWVLWWIDSIIAVAVCFHMTFMVMSIRKTDLSSMTSLWLLPVLPMVIASTSGGLIAQVLEDPQHQQWTLIVSYIFWGCSISLAMTILILYFLRLTVHELPPKEAIVTVFLPIGPLGLGGYSLMIFGKVALHVLPATKALPAVPIAGEILYVFGFIIALIMWGFGLVWFFFAVVIITKSRRFPFNMGWWGFTFPIGVFALSTFTLGNELESRFFKILGTILTVWVVILWIIIAIGTVHQSVIGEMFHTPCLETDMKRKKLKLQKIADKLGEGKMV